MTSVPEKNLLIVDDEEEHLQSLRRIFQREGYRTEVARSGREAIERLRTEKAHVVLTDLVMPGDVSGMDVLKNVRTLGLESQVILMTAYGDVETAVEAMKTGAYDFITKPISKVQVVQTVRRAIDKILLLEENRQLRARLDAVDSVSELVGSSASFRKVMDILVQAAPSTATILILGDSGTGKELFARAIHRLSGREKQDLVAVNCAALPESLLEAELFGYEKGAFTGAMQRREGRLMAAHQGTLFLDEIADMSLPLQAKLLRVLQDGQFERLGSSTPIRSDFRLVAATNRNLKEEVEARRFREDLFYRLNGITLNLPPLRDRQEDIPPLVQHFIRRYCEKNGKPVKGITNKAVEWLSAQAWPGNVRELEKAIERAVILSNREVLDAGDFGEGEGDVASVPPQITIPFGLTLEEIENRVIRETLLRTAGDKKLAAQILGISVRTIYRWEDKE